MGENIVELFIVIIFCFLLPMCVLVNPIRDCVKNDKSLFKEYKGEVFLFFIFMIGSLVRLFAIGRFPNALNVDEASSGYDAFSLMKWGVDRAGNSYPVYLYAWGSGQSVLYSYLMIPVIAVTGLTEYGIRLPMAITGVISLYVFYYLIKNIFDNKKYGIIATAFLAICPWHIMKSRWGMECNIFPDLILLASLLLVLGLKKKKTGLQVLAFVVLAISSYSYGTSYLFLPVFVLGTLGYLIYKKELTVKKSIIYLLVMFVLCIPIIVYIFINTFGLEQITIGKVTIPKLLVNRYDEVSTVFSGNIFENCVKTRESGSVEFEEDGKTYMVALNLLDNGYVVLVASDITAVRKGEKMRSEFFANASHELKTPLTAVKGFNDLIALKTNDEEIKEFTKKTDKELSRILTLISDMLDLSRLETQREVKAEDINLVEVAEEVRSSLAGLAENKNISVTVSGKGRINAEKEHAVELVKNLVEKVGVSLTEAVDFASANPAKNLGLYNERGSIEVGKRADITVLDKDYNVLYTIVGGNIVYKR